jgi:hypothetical protein
VVGDAPIWINADRFEEILHPVSFGDLPVPSSNDAYLNGRQLCNALSYLYSPFVDRCLSISPLQAMCRFRKYRMIGGWHFLAGSLAYRS